MSDLTVRARLQRIVVVVLAAGVALIASSAPAVAAQAQNAYYYSHWSFAGSTTGYWNVDQEMKITKRAASTYWAQLWNWKNASFGGYVGLQTNGVRGDGSTGDTAIFSLWNADAASGPHCGQFDGEGSGWSCRLAYKASTKTFYRYRVWRLNNDGHGQWWGAWIQNTNSGTDTYVGAIRVPSQYVLITNVQNFVEYFGAAVQCTAVPRSSAIWTQPAANSQGGGGYQYGSHYVAQAGDKGSCTGGSATPVDLGWTKGVRVVLGGN